MKRNAILLGLLTLGTAANAYAEISNGDFEDWNQTGAIGWTTVDSGIRLRETNQQVRSGNRAAEVTVMTGAQETTDLRQRIQVTAGQTYDFSVWVLHTEGQVAARLYVDGYQGYSLPANTGQWQQLTYRYTASVSQTIEIGLRFYDQPGFDGAEVVYVDQFSPAENAGEAGNPPASGNGIENLSSDYQSAAGLSGYALKTALHQIIQNHSVQSYGDLWTFYYSGDLDSSYEKDGSILDIYSEKPAGADTFSFSPGNDQCGSYRGEGDCYNREHSFPRSWFGGAVSPMNTDVHHIFPTDGYVNSKRSSYPYGEVISAVYTSSNGSKLGAARAGLGYTGTVFEPIDDFKGDIARAYFYMATRYQNVIAGWESQSNFGDAVLDGSRDQVFEDWFLAMLLDWHQQDPVSQKERIRNEAAYLFQGNRNPFVDYPAFAAEIWED
ncbi:endonuclease (plasmid) [Photobacterium sp. GJ3]|uniref:endonuclease n=1 Tax=Photobacterium sp. GJ3 TaxID=2829502 RepID=UPI001B8B1A69|nr:endonuclease [Photobacterium sp. GJ3]QUJ70255.1 endonuclease [Photobacterium sp. GJ3]